MEESPGMEPYHVRNKMNRRVWTRPEEDVLLYELKKLVANGWRVDNAFRTGYLLALEHALAKRFPGANITGNKHINSKLTVWKKAYKLLFAMFQTDGFRFEPATKMIVVDNDEVWNNYVKGHRDVEHMRFKAFPFYKDWCEVFGNDIIIDNTQGFVDALEDLHPNQGPQQAVLEPPPGYVSRFNVMPETEAQGFGDAIQDLHSNKDNQPGYVSHFNVMPETEAQGFGDAFQDLQSNKGKQPAIEISPASFVDAISNDDARSIAQNETSGGSTRNHRSSKKATPSRKRKAEVSAPPDPPPDPVAQVVGDFLKDMNSACGDLLKKFNLDQDTSADKAKRLLFALGNIPGISDEAQVLVSYKLANNPIVMELFLNMNGGLRVKFVQMLLDGKLS